MRKIACIGLVLLNFLIISCDKEDASHEEMVNILKKLQATYIRFDNYYASEAHVRYYDSLINTSNSAQDKMFFTYSKARALIALGLER